MGLDLKPSTHFILEPTIISLSSRLLGAHILLFRSRTRRLIRIWNLMDRKTDRKTDCTSITEPRSWQSLTCEAINTIKYSCPPKSDGKSYSTWTLFNLIQEFDRKEIKTWAELAQRLGVLPPDLEKGQSTQKVQQYSVRLKRWMRALHIDAFFEYLMNKPHAYYEEVPPLHAPFPEHGRDGVPLEEDLAIRALDPKYRPKRGRRKADEEDSAAEATSTPSKRPHLDTPTAFLNQSHPMSAYPSSAYPSSAHPDHGMRDPGLQWILWQEHIATQTAVGLLCRSLRIPHQLGSNSIGGLTTASLHPHRSHSRPLSQVQDKRRTPHSMNPAPPLVHHLRGRSAVAMALQYHPPGLVAVIHQEASLAGARQATAPRKTGHLGPFRQILERAQSESGMEQPSPHFRLPPSNYPASAVATVPPQSFPVPPSRRGRLSLQVPQHVGGPVHLVTPTLLVNGETDPAVPPTLAPSVFSSSSRRSSSHVPEDSDAGGSDTFPVPQARQAQSEQHPQSTVRRPDREDLKRALAAELLRARITGRKRLRGAEAKALADAMLRRMKPDTGSSSENEMSKDIFPPMCASWLGLNLTENGCSAPNGSNAKTITVQRFRVGKDGYDSPIYDDEEEGETSGVVKETFEVEWSAALGV
ncbi:hypothetical protein H2199_005129 [Coniosporium tulheliwenetii]|uniref:Uncharacterized protein n=1 Tax=Coniosporium tulheliwenetii TaxID=3383036 RepID=A0ACC2Z2H0_9PEZI|nr:hypothetical protein H2199_005129 [Cladosporium sp. JES 115]